MYTLTADSGSTKTTWLLTAASESTSPDAGEHFTTQGINPFHMSAPDMRRIISDELLPAIASHASLITEIRFYGAGCTKEKSPILRDILASLFPQAQRITVDSDMLGAAKALFADLPGIACILGTGANSCLYDGQQIISNISPMGYILGDEGSGAVIGKTFLGALYKGQHRDFIPVFEKETGLTLPDIINKVYREPLPNRFLASLAPFIKAHLQEQPWIEQHVIDCFRAFFRNNVSHYLTRDKKSTGDVGATPFGSPVSRGTETPATNNGSTTSNGQCSMLNGQWSMVNGQPAQADLQSDCSEYKDLQSERPNSQFSTLRSALRGTLFSKDKKNSQFDLSTPVGFVGSIAFHFRDQLLQAAADEGYTISKIMKEPL